MQLKAHISINIMATKRKPGENNAIVAIMSLSAAIISAKHHRKIMAAAAKRQHRKKRMYTVWRSGVNGVAASE